MRIWLRRGVLHATEDFYGGPPASREGGFDGDAKLDNGGLSFGDDDTDPYPCRVRLDRFGTLIALADNGECNMGGGFYKRR